LTGNPDFRGDLPGIRRRPASLSDHTRAVQGRRGGSAARSQLFAEMLSNSAVVRPPAPCLKSSSSSTMISAAPRKVATITSSGSEPPAGIFTPLRLVFGRRHNPRRQFLGIHHGPARLSAYSTGITCADNLDGGPGSSDQARPAASRRALGERGPGLALLTVICVARLAPQVTAYLK